MRHFINGNEIEVPVDSQGRIDSDVLRRLARIPENRTLVLQRPDRSNLVVNPGDRVQVDAASHFVDAPAHTRG